MKRNLFQNITAIPYTSGDAIDRSGFLSAVIGANVASGAEVTVKVEHSDDGETFAPVTDERVFPDTQTKDGVLTFKNEPIEAEDEEGTVDAGGVVNIEVDLVGLKNIVKFTVTGAEGALAVVLGDAVSQPV
jgi:hypothetical protein